MASNSNTLPEGPESKNSEAENSETKIPEKKELGAILKISLPLAFGYLGQVAIGLTDSLMLGRLSLEALGAIGIASSVYVIILTIGTGLLFPVMVLVSQARGAGRSRTVPVIIRQGLWIAAIVSIPGCALLWRLEEILLASGQLPELARMAGLYMDYFLLTVFPAFVSSVFIYAFIAMGWTGTIAVISWFGVGVNVVLDYALIFGKFGAPAMGIEGAALASIIVYIACFALFLALLFSRLPRVGDMVFHRIWKPNRKMLARLVQLGWPKTLELMMKNGLISVSALLAGWFGTQAVAAHTIASQITGLLGAVVSMALANAVSTRIGIATGRNNRAAMAHVVKSGLLLFFLLMLPLIAVFGVFPQWMVTLFVGSGPKAQALLPVATPLIMAVAFFVLADGLRMIAGQALNGLSDMRAPALIAVVFYWAVGLPCGVMLGFAMELGVLGLWYGLTIGMAITAVAYLCRFRWMVNQPNINRP